MACANYYDSGANSELLLNPDHPYRDAINQKYGSNVRILSVSDFDLVRPDDLENRLCILVGTFAALRVKETDDRNIYKENEAFETHFSGLDIEHLGLERNESGERKGKVKLSFANLVKIHRPLLILDEAHNAKTKLTSDVTKRINPKCILEFTATPHLTGELRTNILYSVSAQELKAEYMIKLPIMLTEHANWQEAIADTIRNVNKLNEIAKTDSSYIRPIALIQAEDKNREVNVEFLKNHLVNVEKISSETIAIATGSQRELDGINLFDPNCKILYIITVEALKEGWDCSFAYVFCSVANIHSAKDVEQLLGRVLRMPYVTKRNANELNIAYAHIVSRNFSEAAIGLHDKLVENMGFNKMEALNSIQSFTPDLFGKSQQEIIAISASKPLVLEVTTKPNFESISESEQKNITVEKVNEVFQVTIRNTVSEEVKKTLLESVSTKERVTTEKKIELYNLQKEKYQSPFDRGIQFVIPGLCVEIDGQIVLIDKDTILEHFYWEILDYKPELTEAEFVLNETNQVFKMDMENEKLRYEKVEDVAQQDLAFTGEDLDIYRLCRWIDEQVDAIDLPQVQRMEFIRRLLDNLLKVRKFELDKLIRNKFRLYKAIQEKIKFYSKEAYQKRFQQFFFDRDSKIFTNLENGFKIEPNFYTPKFYYEGAYKFSKHYLAQIGELKSSGEEFDCAKEIDRLEEIEFWIRNIPQTKSSFFIQTSSDKFYPDFVAKLKNGKTLIIEYKGDHISDTKDTEEKINLGKFFEDKSSNTVLFLLATKKDSQGRSVRDQILDKIE